MKKLRWFFKHGTCYEDYSVLYEKDNWILVKCDDTGHFSFGLRRDFGTLYGFPVNQSCLTAEEAISLLRKWIKIDEGFVPQTGEFALANIVRWKAMIAAVEADAAGGQNGGESGEKH